MRIWGRSGGLAARALDDVTAGPQLVCACGATTPLAAMRGPAGRRRLVCRACERVLLDQQEESVRPAAPVGVAATGSALDVHRARIVDLG